MLLHALHGGKTGRSDLKQAEERRRAEEEYLKTNDLNSFLRRCSKKLNNRVIVAEQVFQKRRFHDQEEEKCTLCEKVTHLIQIHPCCSRIVCRSCLLKNSNNRTGEITCPSCNSKISDYYEN